MENHAGSSVTLHVCITCRRGEEPLEPKQERSGAKMWNAFAGQIENRLNASGICLLPVECLSGCKRACTVAVTAPDKWTYVIADLDPAQHAEDILTFAEQYAAHPEGLPLWRERPEIVKRSVLARVPPLQPAREEEQAA
jgi:predicted metal-binding protein